MKVWVQGGGSVSLSQAHFVGRGGEGSVYAKNETAYKIYTDSDKMIPTGKVRELAALTLPAIIKPERILLGGSAKEPIGYTMRHVENAVALCQLFTRSFRERHGVTPEQMLDLVRKLQRGVEHVHASDILIVDLNEMNFLVDKGFQTVYFIDVDSYQTTHYPATAIMPSVRDWKTPPDSPSPESDWFSFAVVSFQMLAGIHPYKGKHPKVASLEERMKQSISVFDREVRVPAAAYGVDAIPGVLRSWYEAVLQQGKRLPPPRDLLGAAVTTSAVAARHPGRGRALRIEQVARLDSPIRQVFSRLGTTVAVTDADLFVDARPVPFDLRGEVAVAFSPRHNVPVVARLEGGLRLFDVARRKELPSQLRADEIAVSDGRLLVRNRDRIVEVMLHEAGNHITASAGTVVATVLEHASRLYDGCAVQNVLGSTFVSLFGRPNAGYQVHVPELDGWRIIEARFERRVLMVLASKDGLVSRFVFRFDPTYSKYDVRDRLDVPQTGINFAVLDTGVCICLNEDEQLEVFANRIGSSTVKLIDEDGIGGDMQLHARDGELICSRATALYRLSMR